MTYFPSCVTCPAKNFSIEDEPGAYPGAECQEDKMLQIAPPLPHAEMKFRKGPGIAIVLDQNWNLWEFLQQTLLQRDMMPAG
jgi:hypothetical protein